MHGYDHKAVEEKWQKYWGETRLYETKDAVTGKDNHYLLVEFPYPSGNLHVGHWYAFAVPDIYARFLRMRGKNVLFPIGFDAFGLPAENAAIKRGLNPRAWTYENIAYMEGQLARMGASFDWARKVVTADPEYYKWTQWQFLQFFKKGLVYQGEGVVNWCPSCKTVLANEQVIAGFCERCDTEVEKRVMNEWKLRITDYAERLVDDLETLDWPEHIKEAQRQWIGRSHGAEIDFALNSGETVTVFTTRSDTLFGATYLVLSPEHKLVDVLKAKVKNSDEAEQYVREAGKKAEIDRIAEGREKTGVELRGISAINPATGEKIPVWIADYVLATYGTGAIMAVPAHDERDFAFAKRYNLPLRQVITPRINADEKQINADVYGGEGTLVNSGEFDGMSGEEAREKITEKFGKKKTTYRLRDWGFSRQRYWGVPIPLIHCEACGVVPVPEDELPVVLPEIEDYLPTGDGKSPLAKARAWMEVACPSCGGSAERETDTMDTFIDSSWYFLRYTDPKNEKEFASKEKQSHWLPVNFYSGGSEHTTMHLLYSRFWHKALFDLGLVADSEPYLRRMNRGLIMGPDGQKMSKSRGNVVDPDAEVEKFGADTVRMYLAFIGPYNEVGTYPWNPDGIVGVRKFLERVARLFGKEEGGVHSDDVRVHRLIKQISDSITSLKLNTAVAAFMGFLNEVNDEGLGSDTRSVFLRLLAPFAPHLAEELWTLLGHDSSVHLEEWPVADEQMLAGEAITIAVQVDGKTRGTIKISPDLGEDAVMEEAKKIPAVVRALGGRAISRTVYIAGRIINFLTL